MTRAIPRHAGPLCAGPGISARSLSGPGLSGPRIASHRRAGNPLAGTALAIALALTALPARSDVWLASTSPANPSPGNASSADVFSLASGIWGLTNNDALSCQSNPHRVGFSADRSRSTFEWDTYMLNYQGEWDLEGTYDVLDHSADSITMSLDGESRLTDAGEPVVWIMRILDGGNRYCWGRTDWPAEDCLDNYIRCPQPQPTS